MEIPESSFSAGKARRITRRKFLGSATGVSAAGASFLQGTKSFGRAGHATRSNPHASGRSDASHAPQFELDEITIAALNEGMKSGRFTARSLAEKYLQRIHEIDKRGPAVNAVIEINPDALSIAEALDRERKAKGPRGPLHGIPVLIKDNIGTHDRMMTTAGSLALLNSVPSRDAFVAQRLREAGAVILGKTNLSEWANIRSSHSSSGWSGRGGQTRNPYALDRNPSGSSSGSGAAVAANMCAAAVGTETDGSIVSPSSVQGIVGIKPTVGLVSRSGIIPISHTQDTAGPMARTVADAAALLGALAANDPNDPATAAGGVPVAVHRETPPIELEDERPKVGVVMHGKSYSDYTQFLDPAGLKGARIGVGRKHFEISEAVQKLFNEAVAAMKHEGAEIIDPADIETLDKFGNTEFTVLLYELKADMRAYLATLGPGAPVKSLADIIEFNEKHRAQEMPYFGQDTFIAAQAKGDLTSKEYLDALANDQRLARTEGIDALMTKYNLDAIVAPTNGPAGLTDLVNGDHDTGGSSSPAAVAGYPSITVPMGFVFGLPVGISFFGRAWSEPLLIKLAYAFEQATKHRKPPRFLPTADLEIQAWRHNRP